MNCITLEEHFVSRTMRDQHSTLYGQFPERIITAMLDVGDKRIADMDAGQVKMQVLSHGPGLTNAQDCVSINDGVEEAVSAHPDRFAGFATLPMLEPEAATRELKRCIKDKGFKGALLENHTEGTFYDGEAYTSFWETAEELDVPIYIHPAFPSEEMEAALYKGNFSDSASMAMGACVSSLVLLNVVERA